VRRKRRVSHSFLYLKEIILKLISLLDGVVYKKVVVEASSKLIMIETGQSYLFQVESHSYAYFGFIVSSTVCQLQINLRPISGDPDLVVSYGEEKRPTLEHYDWGARHKGG
jgi:hypothetical protein